MTLPTDCLKFFAAFIEREIGIIYSEVNFYQLEGRLEEIAKSLSLPDTLALWEKARRDGITGALKLALVDVATNNETSFFRDINIFKAIRSIVEKGPPSAFKEDRPFRVWSAACSTGQELYSAAILFSEIKQAQPFHYAIHATDISERVLRRAEAGRYTQLEVQRGLSEAQLSRYFNPDQQPGSGGPEGATSWTAKAEIKRGMSFQKLNLLDDWLGLGKFNLILCRNVLIYQTVENKRKVVARIHDHLEPGGHLILGGAESLIGVSDQLEYITVEGAVVYRKRPDATKAVVRPAV